MAIFIGLDVSKITNVSVGGVTRGSVCSAEWVVVRSCGQTTVREVAELTKEILAQYSAEEHLIRTGHGSHAANWDQDPSNRP